MVARNGDVDYATGRDIWWEEDGGEFDLPAQGQRWVNCRGAAAGGEAVVQLQTGECYQTLVFCEKNSNAGIDLADSERDEHCVRRRGGRWIVLATLTWILEAGALHSRRVLPGFCRKVFEFRTLGKLSIYILYQERHVFLFVVSFCLRH